MLVFVPSLVAYLAFVFSIPLIISTVNTLEPTVPNGLGLLLQSVNGILYAFAALFAGLLMLRGYGTLRESRSNVE